MRPILPPDLDLLTRLLLSRPKADRAGLVAGLLDHADIGDRYRKRTGRRHPLHGDGSVVGLAMAMGSAMPPAFCDAAYRDCMADLLAAMHAWHVARSAYHVS